MKARFDDLVNATLALLIILMPFAALVLLLKNEVPAAARDMANMLVGAIVATASLAANNRFGTTTGSARKDATIETLANNAQAALAPVTTKQETNSSIVTSTSKDPPKDTTP